MDVRITDEKLARQIERLARQERCPEEQLIARALHLYEILLPLANLEGMREQLIAHFLHLHEERAQATDASSFLLAISGLGSSGERDISERDEEILATEVDSVRSWRLERDES